MQAKLTTGHIMLLALIWCLIGSLLTCVLFEQVQTQRLIVRNYQDGWQRTLPAAML